jgi:hypothetical protein
VHEVPATERSLAIASKPLEATLFEVGNIGWAYVFHESGLSIKRAVHARRPEEARGRVQARGGARQKSKLVGTIRGSFFVIKGEY